MTPQYVYLKLSPDYQQVAVNPSLVRHVRQSESGIVAIHFSDTDIVYVSGDFASVMQQLQQHAD